MLLGLTTLFTIPALAQQPDASAANAALAWLRTQQLDSGAFPGFTGEPDPSATADAVYAFAAGNIDPSTVTTGSGDDPVEYLIGAAGGVAGNPGAAAKLLLALYAAGLQPDAAEPVDLVGEINAGYDPATGFYGMGLYNHTLAVLALAAYDLPIEPDALALFATSQIEDGSWGFTGEPEPGSGDSNTTAMAIQALAAAGDEAGLIEAGVAYLVSVQTPDGGFSYDANEAIPDANSTALAIQALVVAGVDPTTLPNGNALTALTAFQKEFGVFFWRSDSDADNLLATTQAVPALMLVPFPVPPVEPAPPGSDPLLNALIPAEPQAECAYFEATRHNVCGAFQTYWNAHNGLLLFGLPLSEAYTNDGGLHVQYFERARFEWHPDLAGTPYEVLLSRLGADLWDVNRPFEPLPEPEPERCVDFPETGQRVCGAFADIWAEDGGLAVFGYPLTPYVAQGDIGVQYFERAVFELRPGGWPDHQDVFFSLVGAETIEHVLAE